MGAIDPFIKELTADEPSLAWFGFTIEKARGGVAVISGTVRADQVNGNGMAHGGLVFALADQAFAMAANTVLRYAATADAQIQYLAPARSGDTLFATGRVSYSDDHRAVVDVVVAVRDQTIALYRGTARAGKRPESKRTGSAAPSAQTPSQSELSDRATLYKLAVGEVGHW